MANGIRRRTVYVGTIIAVFAMIAGFAVAASGVLLSHHIQNASGDSISPGGAVTGVSYVSTELGITNTVTFTVHTGLGTPSTPVTLASGMNVFCMSGPGTCTEGNFSEQVNYSFSGTSPAFSGAMEVEMFISYTIGVTTTQKIVTLYVVQSTPTASTGNLLLYWDLGTATVTVNGLTVTLTQCQGASSCP